MPGLAGGFSAPLSIEWVDLPAGEKDVAVVELIWDGKYDENDKRVAPLKVALPFQTVETVNEDPMVRQKQLELFAAGRETDWRNRLIWGDKKYVLPSLLPEFAGQVDLIYIDPPFATGQDFSYQAQVGDENFEKEASVIEQKAYRYTWGNGLDGYVHWFYETAVNLQELLSDTGSLYVHLDPVVSHYVKTMLDSILGQDNYRNEITWRRIRGAKNDASQYGRSSDSILYYSNGKTMARRGFSTRLEFIPLMIAGTKKAMRKADMFPDLYSRQVGPPATVDSRGGVSCLKVIGLFQHS